jgi:beta-lactamase regulating signal transducer with metallopeptidase domain
MNTAYLSIGIESLGWTLLHFVWQAAVIAAGLACVLRTQRSAAPNARYLSACAALGLMVLAAAATFAWQWNQLSPGQPLSVAAGSALANELVAAQTQAAPIPVDVPYSVASLSAKLRPWLPTVVIAWAAGVGLLSMRLVLNWRSLRELRSTAAELEEAAWRECFDRLRERLSIRPRVRLLLSNRAVVPMTFGWVKPILLIPAALVTGLTGPQLEAVLAHELAHIRRCDYLVNLLQNAVEIMFFYHPAVWWVSHRIRAEREFCCDDMAAAVAGGTLSYGRTLAFLEQLQPRQVALSLAAAGGSLVERIRRLVGVRQAGSRAEGWPVLTATAAMALIACVIMAASDGLAQEKEVPQQTALPQDELDEFLARVTLSDEQQAEKRIPQQANTDGFVVELKGIKPTVAVKLLAGLLVDADGKPVPQGLIQADDNAGTVVVRGSASQVKAMIALIQLAGGEGRIIEPDKPDSAAAPSSTGRHSVVVQLKRLRAERVSSIITELFQDVEGKPIPNRPVVAADELANRIVVSATKPQVDAIIELMKQLDNNPPNAAQESQQAKTSAESASPGTKSGEWTGPVTINRIPESNVFILRGAKSDVEQVQRLLVIPAPPGGEKSAGPSTSSAAPPTDATARRLPSKGDYKAGDQMGVEIISLEKQTADVVMPVLENAFPQLNSKTTDGAPQVHVVVGGKTIVIRARPTELTAIRELIDSIDNLDDPRLFWVVQLRRGPPNAAANSIRELMGVADKPYNKYGFRVTADVANNRILVRANKAEREKVMNLLRQLGEDVDNRGEDAALKR